MQPEQSQPGTPLPFDGADNFRELGGYPVQDGRHIRRGVFWRTGALGKLVSEHDRSLFLSLGIRSVLDTTMRPGLRKALESQLREYDSIETVFYSCRAFHYNRHGILLAPGGNCKYPGTAGSQIQYPFCPLCGRSSGRNIFHRQREGFRKLSRHDCGIYMVRRKSTWPG